MSAADLLFRSEAAFVDGRADSSLDITRFRAAVVPALGAGVRARARGVALSVTTSTAGVGARAGPASSVSASVTSIITITATAAVVTTSGGARSGDASCLAIAGEVTGLVAVVAFAILTTITLMLAKPFIKDAFPSELRLSIILTLF